VHPNGFVRENIEELFLLMERPIAVPGAVTESQIFVLV
jgi:hypothetical protein